MIHGFFIEKIRNRVEKHLYKFWGYFWGYAENYKFNKSND